MGRVGRFLRLVGLTVVAAGLASPFGAGALVVAGAISASEYPALVIAGVPIYFVVTLAFGWPLVWVLQRRDALSPLSLGGFGALVGAVGGLAASGFGFDSWIVLTGLAALSGFVAGAVLGRFAPSEVVARERAADRYAQESNGAMRYRAFFSYARADDRIANWLWTQLDSYVTPKDLTTAGGSGRPLPRRLHPIFRDRVDLSVGGEVSDRLGAALAASEHLIVLCSPHSAKSEWVNYEVKTFIETARSERILPVIADGEPDSDDPSRECLPPSLRGTRILAADLRHVRGAAGHWVGDGRQDGALKLIAGLLGIEFDALVRRERRRQQQRAAAYMAASAVMGALAIVAGLFLFVTIESFRWSLQNLDSAVETEFDYLAKLYNTEGPAAAEDYLRVKTSSAGGRLVCLAMLDERGAVIGGDKVEGVFPVPAEPGPPQRFTSEMEERNYFGSPFFIRSDGIAQRISPAHVVGAASCNLQPPLLYGVFRAAFTEPPQIQIRGAKGP